MGFELSGVFAASATPFNADLSVDTGLMLAHCQALLARGCHGLAPLGTTGEAVSLSVAERFAVLEALIDGGVLPSQILLGVGAAALRDTNTLVSHAMDLGVRQMLVLPPFYYKPLSEDALFASFAQVIEAAGRDDLRVVLYHIPHISGIAIPHDVIERLLQAFPGVVIGIKDSSGDWDNLAQMRARFPDFALMTGADPLLGQLLDAGGAGCITGAANLMPELLRGRFDGARELDDPITKVRQLTTQHAQIPSLKALIGAQSGEPGWARTRAPLLALKPGLVPEMNDTLKACLSA